MFFATRKTLAASLTCIKADMPLTTTNVQLRADSLDDAIVLDGKVGTKRDNGTAHIAIKTSGVLTCLDW